MATACAASDSKDTGFDAGAADQAPPGSSSGTSGRDGGGATRDASADSSSGGSSSGAAVHVDGGPDALTPGDTGVGGSPADAVSDALREASTGADGGQNTGIAGWKLTWSDEFDGPDGSAVDGSKWVHDVGGSGWGNQELEYYTSGTQNAVVSRGALVITATPSGASSFQCWYGTCQYTSARLKTQGLFAQAHGRFEARIQLPAGQGLWPAFWTLGNNIDSVNWPACGEIDIMETVNAEPLVNRGSMHGPVSPGSATSYNLTGSAPATASALSTSFHTYAIEWDPGKVTFLIDEVPYETQTQASLSQLAANGVWEFDHPFFIVLNVAVGGTFPGSPNATTIFPQTMRVDWIRVYERTD